MQGLENSTILVDTFDQFSLLNTSHACIIACMAVMMYLCLTELVQFGCYTEQLTLQKKKKQTIKQMRSGHSCYIF